MQRSIHSGQDIATVDHDIASRHVSRGIAGKVEIQGLDLIGVPLSSQRRHAISFVDHPRRSSHLGVEKSRRDHIYSSEIPPLSCKTLTQMCDSSFRRIVYLAESVNLPQISRRDEVPVDRQAH